MPKAYRLRKESVNELAYANPAALDDTMTLKIALAPKKAGVLTVNNVKTSINANRSVDVEGNVACTPDPCKSPDQERISVTLQTSGSTKSAAAIKQAVKDVVAAWDKSFDADLAIGFLPSPDTFTSEEGTLLTFTYS